MNKQENIASFLMFIIILIHLTVCDDSKTHFTENRIRRQKQNGENEKSCPASYFKLFDYLCIREYTLPHEKMNWYQAKETCENNSAQLFTSSTNYQYEFPENGTWLDKFVEGKLLYNSSIITINEINQTSRITDNFQCFSSNYTFDGNLREFPSSCKDKRAFRCAISANLNSLRDVPWCPQGWLGSEHSIKKCLFIHFEQIYSYEEAQERCRSLNSYLFVDKNSTVVKLLESFFMEMENKFIKLEDWNFWSGLVIKNNTKYWNSSSGLEKASDIIEEESSSLEENMAGLFQPFKTRWRPAMKNETYGFICEKVVLKKHRLPRVSLTIKEIERREIYELTCKGQFFRNHSLISWYINGMRVPSLNSFTYSKIPVTISDFIESETIGKLKLQAPLYEFQGEIHCQIGVSEFIPSAASNKIMFVVDDEVYRIISIVVNDTETDSYVRIRTLLQAIVICDYSIENIWMFRSENSLIYIVLRIRHFRENMENCVEILKKKYPEMEFQLKFPSKCPSEVTTIQLSSTHWKNLTWPTTALNSIEEPDEPCIDGEGNILRRKCSGSYIRGADWEPIKRKCEKTLNRQSADLRALSKTPVSENNVSEVTENMRNLVNQMETIQSYDVIHIAEILKKISSLKFSTIQVIEDVGNVIERVLNIRRSVLKVANDLSAALSRITKSLEEILKKSEEDVRIEKASFYMESINISFGDIVGVSSDLNKLSQFDSTSAKFIKSRDFVIMNNISVAWILPKTLPKFNDSYTRMSFIIYKDGKLFPLKFYTKKKINSVVISATVQQYEVNFMSPVRIVFQPYKIDYALENSICVFWDYYLNNGIGDWSDQGCWLDEIREGKIICKCSHLTHFAVLMNFYGSEEIDDHAFHLSIITYIGCGISIFGLLLTLLTFALFKKFRKKLGNKVLCNFSLSLLFVLIIFLVGIRQVNYPHYCLSVAVLLHYFLLVTFGWMLVEAVLHYLLFVRVFNTYIPRFIMKAMICAWGLPLIIVAIVLCIDVDLYKGSSRYCWMSRRALIYSFLFPVGIIMFVNVICYVLVFKSIICDRKNVPGRKPKNAVQVFAAVCILVLFGLTWIFGFLAIEELKTFFQYLFCICNSLQGFLIFAFMVVRDNNARDLWASLVSRNCFSSNEVSTHQQSGNIKMNDTLINEEKYL